MYTQTVFHGGWKCCLVFASFLSSFSNPKKQLKPLETANLKGEKKIPNPKTKDQGIFLEGLYLPRIWVYFWAGRWGREAKGSRYPLLLVPLGCGYYKASPYLGSSWADPRLWRAKTQIYFCSFPLSQCPAGTAPGHCAGSFVTPFSMAVHGACTSHTHPRLLPQPKCHTGPKGHCLPCSTPDIHLQDKGSSPQCH